MSIFGFTGGFVVGIVAVVVINCAVAQDQGGLTVSRVTGAFAAQGRRVAVFTARCVRATAALIKRTASSVEDRASMRPGAVTERVIAIANNADVRITDTRRIS